MHWPCIPVLDQESVAKKDGVLTKERSWTDERKLAVFNAGDIDRQA